MKMDADKIVQLRYSEDVRAIAWNTPVGCNEHFFEDEYCGKDGALCNKCISIQYLRELCNERYKEYYDHKEYLRELLWLDD